METLKPLIIETAHSFHGLYEIGYENKVATINGKGDFSLLTIGEDEGVELEAILPGFPESLGSVIRTDPEHNMMWQERMRGFYALDIETKQTGHVVASGGSADMITHSYLLDSTDKSFFIGVVSHAKPDPPYIHYVVNNLETNEVDYKSPDLYGMPMKLGDDVFLFPEFINKKMKWSITDLYLKEKTENKLTKKLTQLQVRVWPRTRTIHQGRRMMLGTGKIGGNLVYYSVRWSEDFEDIKIEPIILQRYKGGLLGNDCMFSSDGSWIKSTVNVESSPINAVRLLIFHTGDFYPQGLSMPIVCGYTGRNTPGAFMQHSEWGTCYVEQDSDFPNKLFVYKLNEGLVLLAEQARNGEL